MVSQAQSTEAVQQAYTIRRQLIRGGKIELEWWAQVVTIHNQWPVTPDMIIQTDTSLVGWGVQHQGCRTGRQ